MNTLAQSFALKRQQSAYSYHFYRQPAWLQVMFKKMQISVDRYCRINKAGEITYTAKHAPDTRVVQSKATSLRIFTDLYGVPPNA
jgi:hypothetical protein